MTEVRWGLLSTARINRLLIPAIRASARGSLRAVASRSVARAESYAEEWGIPEAFGSYEAMLASESIDAVYLSLPNSLHAVWAIRAMRAGKHVLCEKPLALTLAEVDAMTATARETGCVLAEAFMYRHHNQARRVVDLVRSGQLGRITLIRSVFNFAFDTRDNIRLAPALGGGCLWDVGVYPVSLAQCLLDESPIHAAGTQWLGETGVDEVFSGQLSYASGAVAQVSASFCTPFHTHAEILGTHGRIVLDRPFVQIEQDRARFIRADEESTAIDTIQEPLYDAEVADMHAAILDGDPCHVTLAESRRHIETVLALYESARTGQVVSLG